MQRVGVAWPAVVASVAIRVCRGLRHTEWRSAVSAESSPQAAAWPASMAAGAAYTPFALPAPALGPPRQLSEVHWQFDAKRISSQARTFVPGRPAVVTPPGKFLDARPQLDKPTWARQRYSPAPQTRPAPLPPRDPERLVTDGLAAHPPQYGWTAQDGRIPQPPLATQAPRYAAAVAPHAVGEIGLPPPGQHRWSPPPRPQQQPWRMEHARGYSHHVAAPPPPPPGHGGAHFLPEYLPNCFARRGGGFMGTLGRLELRRESFDPCNAPAVGSASAGGLPTPRNFGDHPVAGARSVAAWPPAAQESNRRWQAHPQQHHPQGAQPRPPPRKQPASPEAALWERQFGERLHARISSRQQQGRASEPQAPRRQEAPPLWQSQPPRHVDGQQRWRDAGQQPLARHESAARQGPVQQAVPVPQGRAETSESWRLAVRGAARQAKAFRGIHEAELRQDTMEVLAKCEDMLRRFEMYVSTAGPLVLEDLAGDCTRVVDWWSEWWCKSFGKRLEQLHSAYAARQWPHEAIRGTMSKACRAYGVKCTMALEDFEVVPVCDPFLQTQVLSSSTARQLHMGGVASAGSR
mmetsp:Transcript_62495/g.179719  ORF Transcript_62495/g.179719 Transcript_62495/m.179719 type:complete len:577 (+) Transcript_62495:119-1849(+)